MVAGVELRVLWRGQVSPVQPVATGQSTEREGCAIFWSHAVRDGGLLEEALPEVKVLHLPSLQAFLNHIPPPGVVFGLLVNCP